MSAAHDPVWDAQQLHWLQALGHDVLTLAGAAPAAAAPARDASAPPARAAEARDQAEHDRTGPHRRAQDLRAPQRSAAPVPPDPAPAAGAPSLLDALARAAGRRRDDEELLRLLPPLSTLHGNPSARRALWPQLRALRRRPPG